MLFFLFEFFSDQLLAFMVLSVVWLSEIFSVICLRAFPSIRFFPRAFFFYFCLFHIYFFSFPFGFSYLALFTTVLFIQHSMVFCWNTFEIPALESGLITALAPRVGMGSIVRDARVDEGIPTALTVNQEEFRTSVRGPPSAQRQNHPDPQSTPLASRPLTIEVPSNTPSGPVSGSLSVTRRVGSISETDLDHEMQLRESYCRNVELSRRIQQEQLSAMLGIHMPPNSTFSLSSHSTSLPPSPHRSRSSSMYNSTPSRSPYLPFEDRGLSPVTPLNTSTLDAGGESSILSYPLSVMASIGEGLRWMGLPVGGSASREYIQQGQEGERGHNSENDSLIDATPRYSDAQSTLSMHSSQDDLTQASDYGDVIRSRGIISGTLSHPVSTVVTPARIRLTRSASGSANSSGECANDHYRTSSRRSPTHEILPFRSTLRSSLSSSRNNLSGSFDLSDSDTGSNFASYKSRSEERIGRRSREGLSPSNGGLNSGEITPLSSRRNITRKIHSGPSKYQHNELMMYNSDIEVADDLLSAGAARVGGVPVSQSLFSFARPIESSGTDPGPLIPDTPTQKWKLERLKKDDTTSDYFLHNPYDTNSGSSASKSTQDSGENMGGRERESIGPTVEAYSSTGRSHDKNATKSGGHGKSIVLSSESGVGPPQFPNLHCFSDVPDRTLPPRGRPTIGPGAAVLDVVETPSVKNADDSERRHSIHGKESHKQTSLLASKERDGSSYLGSISMSNDWESNNSTAIDALISNASDVVPGNVANVISPARRVPSVNDFGYRRNDFNMFGNDFNEED